MASEPTLDLLDPVYVYNGGAMNSQEIKRIQSAFKARKRLAKFVFAKSRGGFRAIPSALIARSFGLTPVLSGEITIKATESAGA